MAQINKFIDQYFLLFLISAYVLAGLVPDLGLKLSQVQLAHFCVGTETVNVTLTMLLLATLLFIAALSSKVKELAALPKKLGLIISGLAATVLLPVALTIALSTILRLWHSNDELQNLLVGLALIAGMPIAGSSAAWTQNSGGNGGLSLGLIVLSIFLSTVSAPFTLTIFVQLTSGD